MKKIAFIGHDLKFANPIIDYFRDELDYKVMIDTWEGHEAHDEERSLEILNWADILFCEWGLGNVLWYQERKKNHQKLVVRLHRFEMNTKYPEEFDYSKIDEIIAISPFIFEEFHRVAKIPRDKMKVIFNAVDVKNFNRPKTLDSRFNIGMIGYVPKLKRLDRAISIFEKVYEKDSRFHLFIKGKHPKEYKWVWNNPVERDHYEKVFKKIKESSFGYNVHFEGWGDVSHWLEKIGNILSVSDYESFHMAPIEGMASGAYPFVYQREGVRTIFPSEVIYSEFGNIVQSITRTEGINKSPNLKAFVQDNYSLSKVCLEIEKVFNEDK